MARLRWIALPKSKKEKSSNLQPSLWIYACPISRGSSLLQKFVSYKAHRLIRPVNISLPWPELRDDETSCSHVLRVFRCCNCAAGSTCDPGCGGQTACCTTIRTRLSHNESGELPPSRWRYQD